jgi:chaperonin GroES
MPDAPLAIQMLHDRILIKMSGGPGERTSRGGILIPATAEMAKRLVWGEVAGVGQHVRSVKAGERVLFSPEDQYEVEVGGEPTWCCVSVTCRRWRVNAPAAGRGCTCDAVPVARRWSATPR